MIPKCDGRANVGLVTEDRPRAKKALDEFIEHTHFKGLEQKLPSWKEKGNPAFGGTIPISGPFENTHYDGLMLVGDAAGFTSPLFRRRLASCSEICCFCSSNRCDGDIPIGSELRNDVFLYPFLEGRVPSIR